VREKDYVRSYRSFDSEFEGELPGNHFSGAEDNLERGLALVADGIGRAAVRLLVRLGPALRRRTVSRRAHFARALLAGLAIDSRVNSNAHVVLTPLHNANIIGCAVLAAVRAVPELEQGLVLPLRGDAFVGVCGDSHAGVFEGRGDGLGSVSVDGDWGHALEHLKGAGDLVHAEVFGGGALVADFDLEGVGGGRGAARDVLVLVVVGEGGGCCRQGEEGAEEPVAGVHFGLMTVWVW
jgi:hypothetical protein